MVCFLSVIFSAKFTNSPSVMCNVWYYVGVGVSVCILLMQTGDTECWPALYLFSRDLRPPQSLTLIYNHLLSASLCQTVILLYSNGYHKVSIRGQLQLLVGTYSCVLIFLSIGGGCRVNNENSACMEGVKVRWSCCSV